MYSSDYNDLPTSFFDEGEVEEQEPLEEMEELVEEDLDV